MKDGSGTVAVFQDLGRLEGADEFPGLRGHDAVFPLIFRCRIGRGNVELDDVQGCERVIAEMDGTLGTCAAGFGYGPDPFDGVYVVSGNAATTGTPRVCQAKQFHNASSPFIDV